MMFLGTPSCGCNPCVMEGPKGAPAQVAARRGLSAGCRPPRGHTGSARAVRSPTLSSTEVELLLQGTWVTCHTASCRPALLPSLAPQVHAILPWHVVGCVMGVALKAKVRGQIFFHLLGFLIFRDFFIVKDFLSSLIFFVFKGCPSGWSQEAETCSHTHAVMLPCQWDSLASWYRGWCVSLSPARCGVSEHLAPSSRTSRAFARSFLESHSNPLTSTEGLRPRESPKKRRLFLLALPTPSRAQASEESRARRVRELKSPGVREPQCLCGAGPIAH